MNSTRLKISLAVLLGALAMLLLAAGSAGAAPKPHKTIHPPAKVRVGRVALATASPGRDALLVAVQYPIQAIGRVMTTTVKLDVPGSRPTTSALSARVSAGDLRQPDRRRKFVFVHEVELSRAVTESIEAAAREGRAAKVSVHVDGRIDVDDDGVAELSSQATAVRTLRAPRPVPPRTTGAGATAGRASAASGQPFCGDIPAQVAAPKSDVTIPLPSCTAPIKWSVVAGPTTSSGSSATISGGALRVKTGAALGAQRIKLNGATAVLRVTANAAEESPAAAGPAQPVVRAMGDSVTAGFGYYSDGALMPFLSLYECKPVGEILDDACSSNSTATKNGLKEVPYAPDYGLANNVSWAAQWANEYGVTNYKNYAASGSEPVNWAPDGSLYSTTQKIESEDPDYILMTIGANPILANTLFGLEPMQCALESDIFGGYAECVEEAFEGVHLRAELKRLYTNLVETTHATIYVMQYHLSIPSSALLYSVTQIAEMAKLMNETIAAVAGEVDAATSSRRLQVVTPPHFNVGVSLEPVYPSSYTCSYFEYGVDGPSVQSTPTQAELKVGHYLSFCGGPKGGGEPWVISGDTGIHPSAAGYAQMASAVPAPAG
ncbi:MAG TPA: SGNH/GDSL hydrolase family protein [Solirubrobacterales bacterium]|nr:SGNH/GDSL hydrolase family protein [Solirubrobacterales bacterium]